MTPINTRDQGQKYVVEKTPRITKAFWTLNNELEPATRVAFERLIDATEMDKIREIVAQKSKTKPSYTALILKASSIALQELPYANRAIIGLPLFKKLVQFTCMDITVAIERNVEGAEENIVLMETVSEVDKKNVAEITETLKNISSAGLENNSRWQLFHNILTKLPVFLSRIILRMPSFSPRLWLEHRGNACLVNSPARYGVDSIVVDQIWPLTVSFGWIKERPIAINGELNVRKTMPLIIFFDRRVMVGAPAARFLNRLAEILENATSELQ